MLIQKMLTLSSKHIRKSTHKFLQMDIDTDKYSSLRVIRHADGYFIYINAQDFETYTKFHGDIHIPNDLEGVIKLAIEVGCEVLCLDKGAKILSCLPYFEYDDMYGGDMVLEDVEKCYYGGSMLCTRDLHGTDDIVVDPQISDGGNSMRAKDFFKRGV